MFTKKEIDRHYPLFMLRCYLGVWKWPFRRLLQPKRFNAFCIGTLKSGTHSIVSLMPDKYRVEHEPASIFTNKLIIDKKNNKVTEGSIRRYFFLKDIKIWTELESNYYNYYFIDEILDVFPDAKFILTIRDPYTWLDSWLNHTIDRREKKGSLWEEGLEAIFSPENFSYGDEEEVFRKLGLFPMSCYLAYWNEHNRRILEKVPKRQLLIVKTPEINKSAEKIASFLSIDSKEFNSEKSHEFKAMNKHNVLDMLESDYVDSMVEKYCGRLCKTYFPEISSIVDSGLNKKIGKERTRQATLTP